MTRSDSDAALTPAEQMESLLAGHLKAQCLYAAAALTIADHVAEGRTSVDALAAATETRTALLRRLLRALAAIGVLAEGPDGRYGLTPLGETLRSGAADSLRDKAVFETSAPIWAAAGNLLETLRTGEPAFHRLHDVTFYEYLAAHSDLSAVFNRYMTAQSHRHNAAVVEAYDFSEIRTLVDVGGGHGATLAVILGACPDMTGVLFELPEVAATVALEPPDVAARCRVVAGDMFAAVPPGGDAYLIKRAMFDKTDEEAVKVLGNCLAAMNEGGRVLVVDPMLPEPNVPHPNWFADILMMAVTRGWCRTEAQFRELFAAAGLAVRRVIATRSPNFIVEGVAE